MANDAIRAGLRAAAERFRGVMRAVSAGKTDETARMVHVDWESSDVINVSAGYPTGPYGWTPVQALMFDNNLRHPLFGNKRHWYHQGNYPITEMTVRIGIDGATEDFADAAVPILLREYGFE